MAFLCPELTESAAELAWTDNGDLHARTVRQESRALRIRSLGTVVQFLTGNAAFRENSGSCTVLSCFKG